MPKRGKTKAAKCECITHTARISSLSGALLWLPTFLLTLPYAALAHCYGSCLPVPTDHVRRGVGFHACLLVALILFIPTFVLGAVSLVLDQLFYYLFGGVFFVLFGSMKQYKAS